MEIKNRIIEQAKALFLKLGIRSVSMDDICSQLGISKKTIYQHFSDKDQLVEMVLQGEINVMQTETLACSDSSANAIEEVFLTMEMATRHLTKMNPMVLFDLQKFHFNSFQQFMEHKNRFLLEVISNNLKKGVSEGLYRSNLNMDVLSKYRLEALMIPFHIEHFPPSTYNLAEVSNAITENFLYGLATTKGYQLIEEYKQKRENKHGS